MVGFVDGEGCFHVGVNAHKEMTTGFQVLPEFTVVQHKSDVKLLHALKSFFGCGVVRVNHGDRLAYRVRGIEHLMQNIIPFFEAHPLKSNKRLDFEMFRDILRMISKGEHLNIEGIGRIRIVAKKMNRGRPRESPALSETLGRN